MSEPTTTVLYDGPGEQFSHEIGVATGGPAMLEPGSEYELPVDMAVRLVESTEGWSFVGDPPKGYDGIGGMSAKDAVAEISELDGAQLAHAKASEQARSDGGRKSVLAAIDARELELAAGDETTNETEEVEQ